MLSSTFNSSSSSRLLTIFSLLILSLLSPATAATCASPKLQNPTLYKTCTDLPALKSTLHWTYNSSNKTLTVAFTAAGGWVAWGINPTSTGMAGTQAILAYKRPNGALSVKTYNISSYSSIVEGKLSFEVYEKRAEFNAGDGSITIFATVASDGGKVNHVWQVGPGVTNGMPEKHEFKPENLASKASLDLTTVPAGGASESSTSGGVDAMTRKRNTHGILNAISWGLLFPIGVIIARYLRTFDSADPVWFYLHMACQVSAYAIGVAGWATGLKLGSESKGIVFTGHRCIGIVLFSLATLQVFALFLRPKKEHKFRIYWNIYHHSVGYAIIVLGIINVFKGIDILQPEKKWKSTYTSILIAIGCLAVLLEAFTWIVVCRKKTSSKSSKPYP